MAKSSKKRTSVSPVRAFSSRAFYLLGGVFRHPLGDIWDRLCAWGAEPGRSLEVGPYGYRQLWALAAEYQEFARHPRVGDALQDLFLERLLDDPNPFHRKAELADFPQISPSLVLEYEQELKGFVQFVLRVDWEKIMAELDRGFGIPTPSLKDPIGLPAPKNAPWLEKRREMKERILEASSPSLVRELADFFRRNGCGEFGLYRAFRWERGEGGQGRLAGIEDLDPIRLDQLIGYDEARQALLENIEGFVAGRGANNALLYGERGTGKSSTVKALLNRYQERGLRVVEVSPGDLMDYHGILKVLRGRPEKFILFVDDLSFEENETSYKGLKALLEGGLGSTPPNVILVATSNRRHLVKEFFAEREEGVRRDGEVHGQDTVEEKLSLSDRFGLVVSFYTPDQETYLRIVESWARTEGLRTPAAELRLKALQWEKANNVRSGRTARQFINHLKGMGHP